MATAYLQNGPSRRQTGEPFDMACKVMLLGDSGVGKTCLLVRFKDGAFLSGSFISTVGIDYKNKIVELEGSKIKLQIWDTAGQERFRSITHAYYRDSHALLLLYDVTNESSFENIRAWLAEIYEYASQDVIIMLLGNKADLSKQRAVTREQGEKLAKDHNVAFMETSAKTGLNVDLAFMAIARDIKYRRSSNAADPQFNLEQYVELQREKPNCCS
ncbi:ras-related protein Rab-37 [Exaiptasia diaphana]|uniref:small monomeric GTPase n=1 Tax=Exaiptasia diaphana TaxID=2652724 RepID=A0A913Y0H1_EXADI|nr:ras-related protein Rab-37 [Exaiptasia diaphana]